MFGRVGNTLVNLDKVKFIDNNPIPDCDDKKIFLIFDDESVLRISADIDEVERNLMHAFAIASGHTPASASTPSAIEEVGIAGYTGPPAPKP